MYWIFVLLVMLTAGCARPPEPPPKTQLEVRQFQTRLFSATDVKHVMKSVLNVFQDEGYIVKNVALDLGFITATKEEDLDEGPSRMLAHMSSSADARWPKCKMIEATCNISEFGNQIRIRVNFLSKIVDNKGAVLEIKQIVDENFYQDFFSKVDKGMFIQDQNI